MHEDEGQKPDYYTRTPVAKRLPTVGSLVLAFILARALGHSLWAGLLIFLGTLVLCVLVLHFVFRQPLERLMQYKEFNDQ